MTSEATTDSSPVERPAQRESVFAPAYRSIMVSTLTLIALAAFDGMAVTAAIPDIGAHFGVGHVTWVLTAFSFASTVALLASGPLIDSWGVARTYKVTLVVFLVSSLLCAIAPTLLVLVIGRVVQGLAGGVVMAVGLAIIGIAYPPELRPRALAVNSLVWALMALIGPAIASLMLGAISWRGIFFINVPLVVFAATIGWRRLPGNEAEHAAFRLDVRGLLLLGAMVFALLVGFSSFSRWSVVAAGVALVAAALYWVHSGRTDAAVLERRYFATWPFGPMNLIPFAFFAGSLALDAFTPVYVRGGLGRSRAAAAFALAFIAIGWTTGSNVAGRLLDRRSNVDLMVFGFVFALPPLAVGALLFTDATPLWIVYLLSLVQGLGIGVITNATVSLIQRTAAADEMGRASAAHQFTRHLGGTVGTALAGAVLFGVVDSRLGSVEPVRRILAEKQGDVIEITTQTRSAIAAGFRGVAMVACVVTAAGFVLSLWTRARFRRSEAIDGRSWAPR